MAEEFVEVFRTGDRFTAQAAIDQVLGPAGIPGVIRDRASHALPAPSAMPGGFFIAVPARQAVAATAALRDAQQAGALSLDGEITGDRMA
jgi:hypothetical protein